MAEFNVYRVYYYSAPQYDWDVQIDLFLNGSPVGILLFMKAGKPIPSNASPGGIPRLHYFVSLCMLILFGLLPSTCFSDSLALVTSSTIRNSVTIERISRKVVSESHKTALIEATSALNASAEDSYQKHGWGRHPVGYSILIGIGAGFAIGAASGDGGFPFDDGSWLANGMAVAGIGAAAGAVIGIMLR